MSEDVKKKAEEQGTRVWNQWENDKTAQEIQAQANQEALDNDQIVAGTIYDPPADLSASEEQQELEKQQRGLGKRETSPSRKEEQAAAGEGVDLGKRETSPSRKTEAQSRGGQTQSAGTSQRETKKR